MEEFTDDLFPEDPDELKTILAVKTKKLLDLQEERKATVSGYTDMIRDLKRDIEQIARKIDAKNK